SCVLLILDRQVDLYVPRECLDYFDLNVLERPVPDILVSGPSHPDGLVRFPLGRKGECGITSGIVGGAVPVQETVTFQEDARSDPCREGEHHPSDDDDLFTHKVLFTHHSSPPPNNRTQQRAHAGAALKFEEPSIAWPVCCGAGFDRDTNWPDDV